MTHSERRAVLTGLCKAARREIGGIVPLEIKIRWEPGNDGELGWEFDIYSKWCSGFISVRIRGDKLVVEFEDDEDYLELADPGIVTQLVGLILKYFPMGEWP